MKKVIFTAIVLLTASATFAQFEKGRILAGGSIEFSANKDKTESNNVSVTNSKSTSFNFGPKVGYFFINNLAAGLGLGLSASTTKYEGSGDKDKISGVSVNPFVRYYLKPGVFFQGAFGVGSGKDKYTRNSNNTTTTTKYTASNWSLGAGYAYFLNNKVAIEPFLGYQTSATKNKSNDVKGINSGLFVNIGFQIYLDTKK